MARRQGAQAQVRAAYALARVRSMSNAVGKAQRVSRPRVCAQHARSVRQRAERREKERRDGGGGRRDPALKSMSNITTIRCA